MSILRVGICRNADGLHDARIQLRTLDVLLFPELMDGGYRALREGTPPHSLRDEFVSSLRNASKKFPCTIIAGSTFLREGTPAPTNTSLVFRNGKLIHRYDKIHLFKPTGDPEYFSPGKPSAKTFTIKTQGGPLRSGVVICYDVRFPELIRALALQGMHVLFVPARWPKARDDAWYSLLKARAIENQIFVVACNAQDEEGGYSYAFDPLGRMIFSTGKTSGKVLNTFTMNLNRLQASRLLHQNLNDAVFLRRHFK